MNVTVSLMGRFHAYYLADQLNKVSCLKRLITTYPKYEVEKYGIPRNKTVSLLSHEIMARTWEKMSVIFNSVINPQFWLHDRFDKSAWKHIPEDTDIYVGWSSFSERGLLQAKEIGAIAIAERGSSHIEYQKDILKEEYELYGLKPNLPHPLIIEKEKREYDIADYISVPSEFVRRSFLSKGVSEAKLIKVPYGVDLRYFHQLPKRDKIFRVIYAGGMTLRKGVHYLLRAFSELRLPDAELWLIGGRTNEINPFFSKYESCFRYFNPVPQTKLHEYYSQGSVFAICSIEEGLAMVQPQAMACGLPIICTTNTGGEDLITEGKEGYILPIRKIDAVKEKILFLFENQGICREMGQAARITVQNGYTWNDYGNKLIYKYGEMLAEKRDGHKKAASAEK
jgi:glycosyltransferase involved in cell wall biosynthesis